MIDGSKNKLKVAPVGLFMSHRHIALVQYQKEFCKYVNFKRQFAKEGDHKHIRTQDE